jgi:site-specific recombinase XerC
MSDHSHFEELTALAGGGYLTDKECDELRRHTSICAECQEAQSEFTELTRLALPLTRSPLHEFVDQVKTRPEAGFRERFLQRARLEGIALSRNIERPPRRRGYVLFAFAGAAFATLIIVGAFYSTHISAQPGSWEVAQMQRQLGDLQGENNALKGRLTSAGGSLFQQEQEIQHLRAELESSTNTAANYRRDLEQVRTVSDRTASGNAQLLDELQNREKLLESEKVELTRLNESRAQDRASAVAQQFQISQLSEQLRVANADLDLERQLASAGKDVRELMGARQLHVVDVRDTDPSGKVSKAFGRVFLTEGKSLIFYAFDLNENTVANAKRSFEVWGQKEGKTSSTRSLGFLYADDKAAKRWALKVDNPELVNEIDSVFVTVEPAGGGTKPSGQRMLYAYLGEANHP